MRKFRVWSFCSASAKNKFSIVVVGEDVLNSYFHSPDLSATCSGCPREGLIVSERERNTSLAVSAREQGFSASVSAREQGLLLGPWGESKISHSMSRDEGIVVHPVWPLHGDFHTAVASHVPDHRSPFPAILVHVLGCLDHAQGRLTSGIASMKAISQYTNALVKVPESLCQFIKVSRVCARLARCGHGTRCSQTLVSSATLTEAFPSWSLLMLSHGIRRGSAS